jgi:hypothetical protein
MALANAARRCESSASSDMHEDQPAILDGFRELFRRLGQLPREADFAGGLAQRLDLGLRAALRAG